MTQHIHPAFVNTQPLAPFTNRSTDSMQMPASGISLSALRLAVKDLFAISGIPTAAGNPTWLATHPIPSQTNSSVQALLTHGAQYVGKTLTDELAYSLNGQNIHYPTLINPVTPERLPGGSSSGSANAVAADLADIGLGTDTGGSIRVPASYNNLYGLRPSHGLIPCDNMVALAPSFDTVGWMCRSLDELIRVADTLYVSNTDCSANVPAPIKLGVIANLIAQCEQSAHIQQWLETIGDSVSQHTLTLDTEQLALSDTFRTLQGYDIWQEHGAWITEHDPVFAPDVLSRFVWCAEITDDQHQQALAQQKVTQAKVATLFSSCDVLVIPTTPGRSPLVSTRPDELNEYRNTLMSFTAIAGLTGLPQLHLPLFHIDGAPCGVSLIGQKNQDLSLLHIAKSLLGSNSL